MKKLKGKRKEKSKMSKKKIAVADFKRYKEEGKKYTEGGSGNRRAPLSHEKV